MGTKRELRENKIIDSIINRLRPLINEYEGEY